HPVRRSPIMAGRQCHEGRLAGKGRAPSHPDRRFGERQLRRVAAMRRRRSLGRRNAGVTFGASSARTGWPPASSATLAGLRGCFADLLTPSFPPPNLGNSCWAESEGSLVDRLRRVLQLAQLVAKAAQLGIRHVTVPTIELEEAKLAEVD